MGVGWSSVHAERLREREHFQYNWLCTQTSSSGQVAWAVSSGLLTAVWACAPLKNKTITWLRCIDWNRKTETGLFTVKLSEQEWRLIRCQVNEIIQIENGRGQFSHSHVFCLDPLPPDSLHLTLSFYFTDSVVCTLALLPLLRSAIIIFCEFPMWQCRTEPA